MFIGVDPGNQGAICLLNPSDNSILFHDIPPKCDIASFLEWCATNIPAHVNHVWLEDVHSLPGMSAKSNFAFGRNYGMIIAVLKARLMRISYVPPKTWQKAGGVIIPRCTPASARKHITAQRVLQLYPGADIYGPRGGLKDGRADALMIAHYAKNQGA